MSVTKPLVLEALSGSRDRISTSNIVELGLVSEILIKDGRVSFCDHGARPSGRQELEPLRQAAEKVVGEIKGVSGVMAVLTAERRQGAPPAPRGAARRRCSAGAARGWPRRARRGLPAIVRPLSLPHGPGAPARPEGLQRPAARAGGARCPASDRGCLGQGRRRQVDDWPSTWRSASRRSGSRPAFWMPTSTAHRSRKLLGLSGRPKVISGTTLAPMQAYGLKAMSMGFLVDEATPIIWRGPMVVSALNQMLRDVAWADAGGDLDVLVIDMPPGTGDMQLSMAQQAPLAGAIIVSTPQDLALIDARKGLNMFKKVDVPVLGIIENMSYFLCPKCGERSEIFGHGGAMHEAERLGVPFLGGVPLHMEIRELSDAGQPVVATNPESPNARDLPRNRGGGMGRADRGGRARGWRRRSSTISPTRTASRSRSRAGQSYDLPAEMLRVMSPSAEVQGHSPSQRVTVGRKRNVKIGELGPIGNYAVRIVFDDGHDTGLYAWSYLAELGREKDKRWAEYLKELEAKGLSRG